MGRKRKGIGQKEQTQPDLGPAGLVQEALLNLGSKGVIRMADKSIFSFPGMTALCPVTTDCCGREN
jgi:hypothetical protein